MLIGNPYKGKGYKGNKGMQYWWRSTHRVLSLFLCCLDNLMRPFIAIITGSSLVPVTGLKIGKQPPDWHQNQAEMPGLISRIHAVFLGYLVSVVLNLLLLLILLIAIDLQPNAISCMLVNTCNGTIQRIFRRNLINIIN